jgi:glycerol uptake facilitator-like aquaporin
MDNATLTEFLGTSLLIGAISFTGTPALIIAAFAIAVGLGGKISGAHLNPAVTGWALLSGKISQSKAIMYMIAQLAAAVFIYVVGTFIKV